MLFIPSVSVISGAEKPQGTNKPLKRGIWGENCPSQPPPPPQWHKCLLNSSTCPLGAIQANFSRISLLCLFLGDINCTTAGLLPSHWDFSDQVQNEDCSRDRTQLVPWNQEKRGHWCKSQWPHVTPVEGARTCPHGTIEGNVVTELAVACHRAGHGKVLQGRSRELLGTKSFTSSCDSHSKLKGNDFKPGN